MSSTKNRDRFFNLNKERLEHLAFKAIKKGFTPDEFITVAIDVDDPRWKEVVETVMPGHDWQVIRDRGEKPVAGGTVLGDGVINFLCQACPDIAQALTNELPQGVVRGVVMSEDGASVYHIKPLPHFAL